jgi:hypothetical protein
MRARLDLGDCPLCATAIRPGDRIAVGRLGIGGPRGSRGVPAAAHADCVRPLLPRPTTAGVPEMA